MRLGLIFLCFAYFLNVIALPGGRRPNQNPSHRTDHIDHHLALRSFTMQLVMPFTLSDTRYSVFLREASSGKVNVGQTHHFVSDPTVDAQNMFPEGPENLRNNVKSAQGGESVGSKIKNGFSKVGKYLSDGGNIFAEKWGNTVKSMPRGKKS